MIIVIVVIFSMIPMFLPEMLGYQSYSVVSGSMVPEIPVGSIVLVKSAEPSQIVEGEIIVFESPVESGMVITHRVVTNDTAGRQFVTKGDANDQQDVNPVPYSNLIGRVEKHYPRMGYIMQVLSSLEGKILLISIFVTAIILNCISSYLKNE